MKSCNSQQVPLTGLARPADKVYYATIKDKDDKAIDYKVEKKEEGDYCITNLATGKSACIKASDFDFDYGALLRFNFNGKNSLI